MLKKNLVNRIKVAKGKQPNTIELFQDSNISIYQLQTRLIEKEEYISKKPHPVLQKFWDERMERLNSFINQQLDNMNNNKPVELNQLDKNLFVDEDYLDVVKKNYDEVLGSLHQLQLQLEKLQYAYINV